MTSGPSNSPAPHERPAATNDVVCKFCGSHEGGEGGIEEAVVRSNVRRLQAERFTVWRCARCRSIHAKEEVDLDLYYRDYPFFSLEMDWRLRAMYAQQLRRLRKAGLTRAARVLDYGCGSGSFVRFLRARGYQAVGYDAHSSEFKDASVLGERYDCIVCQDVIEHVPDPRALLGVFSRLARKNALIAIGTPDADAIDLGRPDQFLHALHQPFHRHILSVSALREAGNALGWRLDEHYSTMYANTRVPFINSRFVMHFLACGDNTIDVAFEPIDFANPRLWSPLTLWYGLFGYFQPPKTDIMLVFCASQGADLTAPGDDERAASGQRP